MAELCGICERDPDDSWGCSDCDNPDCPCGKASAVTVAATEGGDRG